MTEQDALAARIRKAIGPTMLLGLQDAELYDEPGAQRIREWVAWIAGAIVPFVADEVNAELERIRAAVTEGKSIGRPLTASDIRVAHEVTRKDLAGALDAGLHLNWPQLVAAARRSHDANTAWKEDVDRVRAVACDPDTYENAADVIKAVRAALENKEPTT